MPDPRRPSFPSFARLPPPRVPGDGLVLAVGSRGLLGADQGGGSVALRSEDGLTVVATLGAGAEVEIIAWRPRRGGGTMYYVRPTKGGAEGWLGAASLRPYPSAPRAPKAVVRAKSVAAPATPPKRPVKSRATR